MGLGARAFVGTGGLDMAEANDDFDERPRREIASLKAIHAPVIYFDAIGGGAYFGIANRRWGL